MGPKLDHVKLKTFMFQQNTLLLPCGSKIRSKSLYLRQFQRYLPFFIFSKNSRWPPKVVKFEIFHIATKYSCTTLWVKNSLEIALSLTVFEIFPLFVFCKKTVKETPTAAILVLSIYPE